LVKTKQDLNKEQKTSNIDDFSDEENKILTKYEAGKLPGKRFKSAKDLIDDLHS
jgi:hypothetical protein